jgi:dihydrofolate synthase/folylpolyglutamate synthase
VAISKNAIADGFAQVCTLTGLRGRWEVLNQSPLTICDTGHNGHGIRYVADQLRTLISSSLEGGSTGVLHVIFGMVDDKDIDLVLSFLPQEATYYFTQPATSRAFSAKALQAKWQAIHPTHTANQHFDTIADALAVAQKKASKEDIIFIGGSNYLVGEVLSIMHNYRTITAQFVTPQCPLL